MARSKKSNTKIQKQEDTGPRAKKLEKEFSLIGVSSKSFMKCVQEMAAKEKAKGKPQKSPTTSDATKRWRRLVIQVPH